MRLGMQINAIDSDYAKGLILGASSWCASRGISFTVFSGRSFRSKSGYEYQNSAIYTHISKKNVDCLVFVAGTLCNHISRAEIERFVDSLGGLPLVTVSVPVGNSPCVTIDNTNGITRLLEHLYTEHGCRAFAVMKGPKNAAEAEIRYKAFLAFIETRALSLNPEHVFQGDFSHTDEHEDLRAVLSRGKPDFDVLVCLNDTMAIKCLHIFEEYSVRVPDDVLVSGFDDIHRARHEKPSLTTVTQDLHKQGRLAASLAYDLLKGAAVPRLTTLPTRAMYRQSCGCISRDSERDPFVAITEDNEKIPASFNHIAVTGMEWLRLQDDVIHLRHFLAQLVSVRSLAEMSADIRRGLSSFDIPLCAIVLFRDKKKYRRKDDFALPAVAEVLLYYDEKTNSDNDRAPVVFDPRERMLPEGLIDLEGRMIVASSLYHRDVQLGYIVYEPGNCDPTIYETLCVQLSSTIQTSLVFEARREVQRELNTALTELEEHNKNLNLLSKTDELTDLYNRRGFVSLGDQRMEFARRMGKAGVIVFCDMDGLKKINDAHGHDAGDRALIAMASILRGTFRSTDIVSRFGGDEFVILAIDITPEFMETLRERIDKTIESFNQTSEEPFTLSFSMGAVHFEGNDDADLEQMLLLADTVLYEEKKRKKGRPA